MRINVSITLSIIGLALLLGCNSASPESVAEKALQNIGNGKYMTGFLKEQLEQDSDIFTLCNVDYYSANDFMIDDRFLDIYSVYNEEERVEDCFETNVLFDSFKLVSTEIDTISVYGFIRRQDGNQVMEHDEFERLKEQYSKEWTSFKSNDNYIAGVMYENVLSYCFRYKVDNKDVANVFVLNLPQKGYRVAGVFFDSNCL